MNSKSQSESNIKTFESKLEAGEGTSFYIQGWEPEQPKALLILIHGLGEHTGRYARVAKAMTAAGYAIAGFDLRGHGKSSGARGHFPSLQAIMQDMKGFLDFLAGRFPELPRFLYGHSLGGLLSLSYAIQYGKGLKGVIATGTALRSSLQKQKAKVAMARLLGTLMPSLTVHSGLDPLMISRDPNVVERYRNDPLIHYRASLGFGKAALQAIDLCFARAGELSMPLLMMHGSADTLTYPSGSEDFARLVGETGGDVTLKLWDGFYHEIHNEAKNDEVFKTMIEWLDKHL